MKQNKKIDLSEYKILGLTILQLLGVVGLLGILLTLVLYFFG